MSLASSFFFGGGARRRNAPLWLLETHLFWGQKSRGKKSLPELVMGRSHECKVLFLVWTCGQYGTVSSPVANEHISGQRPKINHSAPLCLFCDLGAVILVSRLKTTTAAYRFPKAWFWIVRRRSESGSYRATLY